MMKIFFFHWLILFLCLMIVVLDIMLFGYDGLKRLVHAGECFKAFALYWFHFLANLFHAAESEGLGGASFGIRICLMVPSLFLTS